MDCFMNYEELLEEYQYLFQQAWGRLPKTDNMSYDDLLQEVTGMYAFHNDLSKGALK